jgi:hypothetical protein
VKIAFAGGSCGMTMVRVGEELIERCHAENISIKVSYIDLWVSDYVLPDTDLVIEMFPYYQQLDIPVLNGRPFLNPLEEKKYFNVMIDKIKDIVGISQKSNEG